MGGQHPQAWAGRGRSSCSATALWSLPGSLTMTLSASSMWGECGNAGVRWTGAGPLARIAVFGTFQQLRSFGTRCPPLSVWCGPHLCTSSYFCRSRPPLTHLQCHPSPSGSYHPRCHPPHLLVGPPHHSRLQISGLPRGNRGTECGRPAHVRHLCLMCATCCALSSLWDH